MKDCPHSNNKSELLGKPKDHGLLGKAVRGFVAVTVLGGAGGAVGGCAHSKAHPKPHVKTVDRIPQQEARELLMATLCPKIPKSPSSDAKCEEAAKKGTEGMIKYYLTGARGTISNQKEQFNDYFKAMDYFKRAIELMGANHPERKQAEQELQNIKSKLASFEKEYTDKYNKLKKLLKESNYDAEAWKDIQIAFERLRVLRIALKKEDESLTPLAITYFDKFFSAGNYAQADEAARMAKALDLENQVSEDDEQRFAIANHLYLSKKAEEEALAKINGKAKKRRNHRRKKVTASSEPDLVLVTSETSSEEGRLLKEEPEKIGKFKRGGEKQAKERQKKLKEANTLFIAQKKEAIQLYEEILKMNPTPEEKRLAESRIAKLKKAFGED